MTEKIKFFINFLIIKFGDGIREGFHSPLLSFIINIWFIIFKS